MFDVFKRKSDVEDSRPWAERLAAGLARSREKLAGALGSVFARRRLDAETLDELETALITADVGIAATQHLLNDLAARWKAAGGEGDAKALLKAALVELLHPLERPLVVGSARPFVIMLAGVNGAGKTTSIGKLARHFPAARTSPCCSPPATRSAPPRASSWPCGASAMASPSSRRRVAIPAP